MARGLHLARTLLLVGGAMLASGGAAQTEPVLGGSFVQLNSQLAGFDAEAWRAELGAMRDVGMDTVIIQYSRYGDNVYYPTGAQATRTDPQPPDESIATLAWQAPSDSAARFVRIEVQPDSVEWTMIPELRVTADGQEISTGLGYSLSPAPDARYADPDAAQGGKLTDGRANFAWPDMVGWALPGESLVVTIDLGGVVDVDAVEVDFMRSDISGVELPSGLAVALSDDGADFAPAGEPVGWSTLEPEAEADEPLRHLLTAAEELDMRVFLGLGLDPSYWQGSFDSERAARENIAVMEDLETLYGESPALAGWYLPEEIDDRSFVEPDRHEAMTSYLAAMADAAHEGTGRPVMVAPYFGMNPDAEAYAAWWDATLERAEIDIIALQDGVGTRRTTTEEGVPVFAALAEVAEEHGVELWSDLEIFEQIHGWPVDEAAWQAVPADIERVVHQLALEAPLVAEFVAFDFSHYMSPRLGGSAEELYRAYQDYLDERGGM